MAISYTKTNWNNDTDPPINAENLNKIESGIESCVNGVNGALPLSGGTMTGNVGFGTGLSINPPATPTTFNGIEVKGSVRLNDGLLYMNNKRIVSVATPSADTDAANKKYVDDQIATIDISAYLPTAGGTMTGNIAMNANKITFTGSTTAGNHSIYTNQTNNYLFIEGVTEITGNLICVGGINTFNKKITNLATPTENTDAANKQYVDDTINQRINSLDSTEVSY